MTAMPDILAVDVDPDAQALDDQGRGGDVNRSSATSLLDAAKLTVPQAARKLGIGETSMRAIVRAGQIPVLRLTNVKVLILERDLEAFLESRHGVTTAKSMKTAPKIPPAPDFVKGSEHLRRRTG